MTNRQKMLWKRQRTQLKVKAHQQKCFGKGIGALEKAPTLLWKRHPKCFGKGIIQSACALEKAAQGALEKAPQMLWKRQNSICMCFGKGSPRCFGKGTHSALEKAHHELLKSSVQSTDLAQLKMRSAPKTGCF